MPSESATFIERARRQQIINAAIQTIVEGGLGQASIAAIAARAGVSPPLIMYYFGSRQGLVDAVLQSIQVGVDAAMEPDRDDPDYPTALDGMLRRYVRHCIDNLPAMLVLTRFRQGNPEALAEVDWSREVGMAELVGFIRDGQRDGGFRAIDPTVYAATVLDAMVALPAELARHAVVDQAVFDRDWPGILVRAIQSNLIDRSGHSS